MPGQASSHLASANMRSVLCSAIRGGASQCSQSAPICASNISWATDFHFCSLTTSESGLTTTCHCHLDGHDVSSGICLCYQVFHMEVRQSMSCVAPLTAVLKTLLLDNLHSLQDRSNRPKRARRAWRRASSILADHTHHFLHCVRIVDMISTRGWATFANGSPMLRSGLWFQKMSTLASYNTILGNPMALLWHATTASW